MITTKKEIKQMRWAIVLLWLLTIVIGFSMFRNIEAREILQSLPINPFAMAFWGLPIVWFVYPGIINILNKTIIKQRRQT